jgi:hypothetical protein
MNRLSGFMFRVLYACKHLMEIKEGKGSDERISSDQEESSRGSTCAFMILFCFLALVTDNNRGFVWLYSPTHHMQF